VGGGGGWGGVGWCTKSSTLAPFPASGLWSSFRFFSCPAGALERCTVCRHASRATFCFPPFPGIFVYTPSFSLGSRGCLIGASPRLVGDRPPGLRGVLPHPIFPLRPKLPTKPSRPPFPLRRSPPRPPPRALCINL